MEKKLTRKHINNKISSNINRIKKLQDENLRLKRESVLLSDKTQQFTEEVESVKVREGGKLVKKDWLIGRIHWKEKFIDQGDPKGKGVIVERSRVVRVNGNWNW